MKNTLITIFFWVVSIIPLIGQTADTTAINDMTQEEMMARYQAYADSLVSNFNYQTGSIQIKDGLATLNLPEGFKFLDPTNSEIVLTDLWGNPPSSPENSSLGMVFREEGSPINLESYAINITWSEDGFIDDSDARSLDYDELLEQMIEDTKLESDQRVQMGYEAIALKGWASAPFYDEANKKLHWALDLQFGNEEEGTLNYNIRALGRKGYLQLNAIGDMTMLPMVQSDINHILPSVNFNEGNRYIDFDPSIDKVAAVGIGGLIAGKVLAKAGILAKLGILLAKFWKIILVALVAIGAGVRRFFGGKEKSEPEPEA